MNITPEDEVGLKRNTPIKGMKYVQLKIPGKPITRNDI